MFNCVNVSSTNPYINSHHILPLLPSQYPAVPSVCIPVQLVFVARISLVAAAVVLRTIARLLFFVLDNFPGVPIDAGQPGFVADNAVPRIEPFVPENNDGLRYQLWISSFNIVSIEMYFEVEI